MIAKEKSSILSHGWLDSFAISMSFICAVHCMITPVLIAVLPILASTFWVHKNFHLWMLLLVVPMALFSLLLGCKKHKNKWVMSFGAIGLSLLVGVAVYESFFHVTEAAHCSQCADAGGGVSTIMLTNMAGAFFLTCAHARNFWLCRKAKCSH